MRSKGSIEVLARHVMSVSTPRGRLSVTNSTRHMKCLRLSRSRSPSLVKRMKSKSRGSAASRIAFPAHSSSVRISCKLNLMRQIKKIRLMSNPPYQHRQKLLSSKLAAVSSSSRSGLLKSKIAKKRLSVGSRMHRLTRQGCFYSPSWPT